jgi:hypothetical protein
MMRTPVGLSFGRDQKTMPQGKSPTSTHDLLGKSPGACGFSGPSAKRSDHVSTGAVSAQKPDLVSVALCFLILLSLYIFVL